MSSNEMIISSPSMSLFHVPELFKLKSDVSDFLARHVDKFDGIPDELKEKDTNQLSIEFGEEHENK